MAVIDIRVVVQKWTLQDPCHPPIALHDVYDQGSLLDLVNGTRAIGGRFVRSMDFANFLNFMSSFRRMDVRVFSLR